MSTQLNRAWLAVPLAVTEILVTSRVWAQSTELEEVIVTAQKREQNIQDVGVAVSALGQQALHSFDAHDSAALAIAVPSLQIQQYSPSVVIMNIRGVSQNDFSDYQEGPNAFYNDEVYISSLGAIAGQMFDLQRVEVLRGPQGTLYGRNATGGLIQAVTAKPTREWESYITLTGGEHSQFATEGAIGGPLSDTVSMRLAVTSNYHDGYYKSLTPGIKDGGDSRFLGGRAQFQFDFGEHTTLALKAEYLKNDKESSNSDNGLAARPDANNLGVPVAPNDNFWGNLAPFVGQNPFLYFANFPGRDWCAGCTVFGYQLPAGGPFVNEPDYPGIFDREFESFTGRFDHVFDAFTFTSISNYQDLSKTWAQDVDATPFPLIAVRNDQKLNQFTQEFRLTGSTNRLNWQGGLYYLTIDTHVDGETFIDPAVAEFFAGLPLGTFGGQGFSRSTQDTDSVAVFGQTDVKLNDKLTLVVGGRYTRDKKDYQFTNSEVNFITQQSFVSYDFRDRFANVLVPFPPFPVTNYDFSGLTPDTSHLKYNDWSGKIQLEVRPNDNTLLYAGVNRGTKAGGFNAPRTFPMRQNFGTDQQFTAALAAFNELIPFREEVLTNYEAGFKLQLPQGRTNVNGSVFHYDYDGYQAFTNNDANLLIRNVPAKLTGVELELNARPLDPLTLGAFATYMAEAKAEDVELPSGVRVDRRMPQTPRWSAGASGAYAFSLGNSSVLTLSTTWKYDAEQFFILFNTDVDREPSRIIGNVRATLDVGKHLQFAAFVNNVTDKEYRIFVSDNGGFISVVEQNWGRPRWAGASFTYRFGNE